MVIYLREIFGNLNREIQFNNEEKKYRTFYLDLSMGPQPNTN